MRLRALTVVACVLAAVACAGDDDTADTETPDTETPDTETPDTETPDTEAPTTTSTTTTTTEPEPEPEPVRFDEAGPFPVGVTTLQLEGLQLEGGIDVEIWYPAVDGTSGTVSYDVRDFTPEAIQGLLEGDVDASFEFDGARDAAAADGEFPVVLFSHGASGMRLQSSFLTSHLATHGMIVVAPDHPARDLRNALGGRDEGEATDSVDDLLGALDLVVAESTDPDGLLAGRVDGDRVAALGHSAGGGTALRAAADDRIDSFVSMASGGPEDPAEYPDVPSLFMAGEVDEIVTPDERTRPAFETAPAPSWYLEIAATGHNGFNDFCTFGGGTGIVGVAEAAGLGGLLDAQPQLRRLGEDGCIPPATPVEQAFPIIRHSTVAFLRWSLGLDDPGSDGAMLGLDVATLARFELPTTVEQR